MKLIIAIVHDDDAKELIDNLRISKIGITKLNSTGGFLKQGNTTMIIGVDEARVDETLDIISESCREREIMTTIPPMVEESSMILQPFKVKVGGATVFIVDVEQFKKI